MSLPYLVHPNTNPTCDCMIIDVQVHVHVYMNVNLSTATSVMARLLYVHLAKNCSVRLYLLIIVQ
jgi:hypothetical protein